jgi:acyl-CoA thioester hydrolase
MSGDGLGKYPVSITVPVAWGEMDAFQHVNNVVYARWAESGRIAYFERLGLLDRKRDDGVGPILARLQVNYRRPVEFPDTVVVETTVTHIGNSSFTMANRIRSEVQGIEAASTEEIIVLFDYRAGKSTPVDEKLRAAIAALEATAGRGRVRE